MRRRYAVAIAAMIMAMPFGNTASAAEPTLEQLEVIQELLEANDVVRLRSYLAENPELLEGYTDLSQLLVQFMAESRNVISYLGFGSSQDGDSQDDAPGVSIY
ncbi:hypothetical protein [uncultured Jannaschia sp.]|uniref:hypothetical protein n=1 Tax=uncultured Jannaschia sp. TaxID=293347 RepID=UPI0026221659|nr:hypothetical protein [uncultured Jannaschia sp.]